MSVSVPTASSLLFRVITNHPFPVGPARVEVQDECTHTLCKGRRFARLCTSQMEAFVEQCAAMQRRMGELTNEAAEVEPVVDALVKSHAEFEVRKDRYKKALAK